MTACSARGHHGPLIEEGDRTGSWQRCADCDDRTGFRPITANPFFDPAHIERALARPRRWPTVTAVLILVAVVLLFGWLGADTLG